MYLSILVLPLLGSIVSGFLGRKIGVTGSHIITSTSLLISSVLAGVAFYEVGICGSPVSIKFLSWIDSEFMYVSWGFLFDSLTVSMLIPVLFVSSLVHIYSISYMGEDPHNQRFFSYLSLFTFFMLVLVTGDNYLIMFIGWEGIGISSYLLINFWFTRVQANKSAILALTMNRVGDMFLSIAFFAIFWLFGNIDYATVFSIAPFINETAITIIGLLLLLAAMGKSAQIGLHSWLPGSMEGLKFLFLFLTFIFVSSISYALVLNNIETLIDTSIFSLPPMLAAIPKNTLHAITGNMLGDGSIRLNKRSFEAKTNKKDLAKYSMTMDTYSYDYLKFLFLNIYGQFTTYSIYPWPNLMLPQHHGKKVTQYNFTTRSVPLFASLHSIWYRWDEVQSKYIKIIPLNIADMFSAVSLAYWIMDDGYFDSYGRCQTIILCTESFTKTECILLQSLLLDLGIKTTLKIRNKEKDTYRIRFSKKSMPLVKELVTAHMHKDFMYKLGGVL